MGRLIFFLSIVLAFGSVCKCIEPDCPSNFLQLHNKCYYFSTDRQAWKDAYFRCSDMDSVLVSLRNKFNSHRLTRYLLRDHLDVSEWWIGASFDWKNNAWKWATSGTPVKHHHFIKNVKSNGEKLEWHCAFLDPRHKFRWNSDYCHQPKKYICLKSLEEKKEQEMDNTIPLIVSRGLLEEDHLKMNDSIQEPAFIRKATKKSRTKRVKFICPKGYRHVRGSCYRFSKDLKTWQDAYYTCDAEHNGTLAIIPFKEHDVALRRLADRIGIKVHERWIGGIYDWEKTAWKWATNGAVIQHQAADRERLRWNCLVWSPLIVDRWTSDGCHLKKYYICQSNGSRVVLPTQEQQPTPQVKDKKKKKKKGSLPSSELKNPLKNSTML